MKKVLSIALCLSFIFSSSLAKGRNKKLSKKPKKKISTLNKLKKQNKVSYVSAKKDKDEIPVNVCETICITKHSHK